MTTYKLPELHRRFSLGLVKESINPILVTHLLDQSKPGRKHRHSSCGYQFETHPTGIGLKRASLEVLSGPIKTNCLMYVNASDLSAC